VNDGGGGIDMKEIQVQETILLIDGRKRMRHRLRDGRQRRPNMCTGKPPDQKMVSREKKGMKRDIPDTAIILVVQSFLVSEKIKSTGLAVMSNLVILIQTKLTEGLWSRQVEGVAGLGSWWYRG